jgi:hypothetical protein
LGNWIVPRAKTIMTVASMLGLIVRRFVVSVGVLFVSRYCAGGEVELRIIDDASGKPVACRVHLKDAAGGPVRAGKSPFFRDHFTCDGEVQLDLPAGEYSYEIEKGPEWDAKTGSFTVEHGNPVKISVSLKRYGYLAAQGWWAADLHVHRPVEDIELLMRAEGISVAPVITWWNDQNLWADRALPQQPLVKFRDPGDGRADRFYHLMAGEDEREGGALLYFGLGRPLAIRGADREYPSPMKFLAEARRQPNVWVDIEKPFWWDAPIWLASGQVDSIGIANNHMCRGQMYESEAWGKPRDAQRLPAPLGNGFWTQEIYYHVLNSGLRIPPSAGSASGVLPNPVGYNRVYVRDLAIQEGAALQYDRFWDALRAGRSFVTNGPILLAQADGHFPGHVFRGVAGKGIELEIRVDDLFSLRDETGRIEIIRNGRVERTTPFKESAFRGSLGHLKFDSSGWFLIRVIADNPNTFRFASTAPWYVEIGEQKRRVSKVSCQFFLDWVDERAARVKLDDPDQRREVLEHHEMARGFWAEKLAAANSE